LAAMTKRKKPNATPLLASYKTVEVLSMEDMS